MARPNLKSPLVAGVVLTVLAVVVVVNLKTFVFKADDSLLSARPGRDPNPPSDLATIVENVLNDSDMLSVVVAVQEQALAGATRDPFRFGSQSAVAQAPAARRARRADPLNCTAVIIDGTTSYALIGGQRRGVGAVVAGYEILDIDTDGVRIVDKNGHERTVYVQDQTDDTNFEITFNSRQDTPAQHPGVVEASEHERQKR